MPVTGGGALVVDVTAGNLAVTGFAYNLCCPAWFHNLRPLTFGGPDVRGSDRIIPGTAGATREPRRVTVTSYALEVVIVGYVTPAGATNSDPYAGLQANVASLISGVYSPGSGDTSRLSTLTLPSSATKTAYVHFEKLEAGE